MVEQKFSKEWLMGFDSTKKWFESIERRRNGDPISKSMRTNYESRLRMMVKLFRVGGDVEATPDSIIEWSRSIDPIKIVEMLNNLSKWLQGQKLEGYELRSKVNRHGEMTYPAMQKVSADQFAHSTARGFFTHNGVLLPPSGKISNGRGETKKSDVNFAIFRVDPDSDMIVTDYSQFRYFLGFLKNRDKLIAMSILSTSQDPVDLLKLNVGFVTSQSERSRLYWEGVRTKTGEEFRTFFSKPITADLQRYVASERNGAGDEDPLFVRRTRGGKVERVKPQNLPENFKNAANKAGFTSGKGQNPFRPKRMRSIFSSACYQAQIDDGARHVFMGHSGSVSESYREIPVANLEKIYSKIEPFLAIYAEDRSVKLAEAEKKSGQALDMALDLREENKKLSQDVKDLREIVDGLLKYSKMLEMIEEERESIEMREAPSGPDEPVIEKAQVSEEELKSQFRERKDELKALKENEEAN